MKLVHEAVCKCCGRTMQTVAEIVPFGNCPGLVAFLCNDCGTPDSALVYPGLRPGNAGSRSQLEGEP
jgi:hypothetical protein